MQLRFQEKKLSCLQRLKWEIREQEQTQEIRLPDSLPDIGRVLGAWGQVILRGKDWKSGSAGVSGGIMAWAMYCPENGSEICCVDVWIPFQIRWDIPETPRDGSLLVSALLRSIDVRSTSARKMMLRACVSAAGEVVVPGEAILYEPEGVPGDVQLLRKSYPVILPAEAGEKPFQIDDLLQPPADMVKLLRHDIGTQIVDKKILAGKAVFRGAIRFRILYEGEDGKLHSKEYELPFSQLAELERDYEDDAQLYLIPAVTGIETEVNEEGKLSVKIDLVVQYMVSDKYMVQVVTDAYSPVRDVEFTLQEAEFSADMNRQQHKFTPSGSLDAIYTAVADVSFCAGHPMLLQRETEREMNFTGQFQVLYYDAQGVPQCEQLKWQESVPVNAEGQLFVSSTIFADPTAESANGIGVRAEVTTDMADVIQEGMKTISQLELTEEKTPNPMRPSLILCRPEGASLWELAKKHATTVEAIMRANDLKDEPGPEKILLIPVP